MIIIYYIFLLIFYLSITISNSIKSSSFLFQEHLKNIDASIIIPDPISTNKFYYFNSDNLRIYHSDLNNNPIHTQITSTNPSDFIHSSDYITTTTRCKNIFPREIKHMSISPSGKIYYIYENDHSIHRILSPSSEDDCKVSVLYNSKYVTFVGVPNYINVSTRLSANINFIYSMTGDTSGNLYIFDSPYIKKVNYIDGTVEVYVGPSSINPKITSTILLSVDYALACDSNSSIYYVDNKNIYRAFSNYTTEKIVGGLINPANGDPATSHKLLNSVLSIAIDQDIIYFSEGYY